ncbi:hypothetical protein ACS0PU_003321 [Formica fusca]
MARSCRNNSLVESVQDSRRESSTQRSK